MSAFHGSNAYIRESMEQLIHFIRLSRPVNLAIIAITMLVTRYMIIEPHLALTGKDNMLIMSTLDFGLLMLSTLLIAAGGYIINDYFDIRADRINKPEKVIVGKFIKRRIAMVVHIGFNTLAVIAGGYLSFKYETIWPLAIHFISTTLLWFYSLYFKRKILTGNLIIAFLAWLTPMLVALVELDLQQEMYGGIMLDGIVYTPYNGMETATVFDDLLGITWSMVIVFSTFAFLTNLVREVIKDMADVEGDKHVGCRTMPIVLGMKNARITATGLILMIIGIIAALIFLVIPETEILMYTSVTILLPFIASIYWVIKGNDRREFLRAGDFIKVAMLFGLGASFILFYYLNELV